MPRLDRGAHALENQDGNIRSRWGLLASLVGGVAAVTAATAWLIRPELADGRGYQEVARWRMPGGEGRFIAVGPSPSAEELRALADRLRDESRGMVNAVVMVFDDAEAAREVRTGSRAIGEERFQAALRHQRAMYVKQPARGEERLVIYAASAGPEAASRTQEGVMRLTGRRVSAATVVVILGAVTLVAARHDRGVAEVRTSRLVVTDREGRPRGELRTEPDGAVTLNLSDRAGVTRARLSVGADGAPRLALNGADGKPRAQITAGPDDWPNMIFFDKHGQRRAVLDVGLGGWPVLALADDRGDDRVVLQVAPDGTPVLVLFDRTGRVVWKTP